MIMLTNKESVTLVKLFFQMFYSTSNDVLAVMNALPYDGNTNQKKSINWGKYLDIAKTNLIKDGKFQPIDTKSDKTISEEQVFDAMILLLEDIYKQTNSDDIGAFLSDLLHGDYGSTSDPAAWSDWEKCLQQVVSERQTAG